MAMVLVVIAAVLMVAGFLLESGAPFGIGLIVFLAGALLHMRNRRNEQLEAMRGRNAGNSGDGK
jgi:hypothetical protein